MHEHNANYHIGAGFFITVFSCLLAVIVTATVSSSFNKPSTPGTGVLSSSLSNNHVKQLRAIHYHSRRRVCSTPARHYVACMAEVTLGNNGMPLTGTPSNTGALGPQQFHIGYNLPCAPGGSVQSVCSTPSSFGPETIAIVDAGNFSSGASGLETSINDYDSYYGLPDCTVANGCFSIVNQSGQASPLPADAGWSDEIALDVETAHMICQDCKIVLVEGNTAAASDLAAAENTAASYNPDAISNSWGDTVDDTSYDSSFNHNGIAVVAATGDNNTVSSGAAWPSDNPNVVGVSGTTLQLNTDNTWASETVWSGSGGGCSNHYSTPSWQTSLSNWSSAGCGSYKAFGDVSADGDPNTGAAINMNGTWYQIGGTSLATPIIASIYALSGGVPSTVNGASVPYSAFSTANFHDITSGNDCTATLTTHCTAGTGFDTPSGLGAPNGLNGFISQPTPPYVTVTTVNQTQENLSWQASSGTKTISGYHIYRNGTETATVSTTNYSDTGLAPNTTYNYYVVAYDSSGNLSHDSVTVPGFTAYAQDINEDGHINLLDLSVLASKYGQCGGSIGRADMNGDGCVNLLDLSMLASKYGTE